MKEKLLAKQRPQRRLTIDGDEYLVVGLTRVERADVMAQTRGDDGKIDSQELERLLLSRCVHDPENGQALLFADVERASWDRVPAIIVAPLVAAVIELNGLDNQDTGRTEKN